MAFLRSFGAFLPARVVTNAEMAGLAGCEAEWIRSVSGIEERRFASEQETIADMAVLAARDCLSRAGVEAASLGMILVASGSAEQRFPGPAATVAHQLGLDSVPALDVPMASAGAFFALSLASRLAESTGEILVIGSEKMSSVILRPPLDKNVAVLFGDGAGACLVSPQTGAARVVDSALHTDGAFAGALRLAFDQPLLMNGLSVILQASRKLPRAISDLLAKHGLNPSQVDAFLLHQANLNLILKVAQSLKASEERFFTNVTRYGNTSSASLLIAAAEWCAQSGFRTGSPVIFSAFGAGFHWGALLAEGC